MPAGSSRVEAKKAGVGGGGAGAPPSFASAAPPPPPCPFAFSSSSSSSSASADGSGVRVRQVELRLYLEDGTADVVERRTPNSGLEQGLVARRHVLSRRAAKGKGPAAAGGKRRVDGSGGGRGDDDADPFAPRAKTADDAPLGPEDIRVGDVINVFGRSITIADADAATRAWLRSAAAAAAAAGPGGVDEGKRSPSSSGSSSSSSAPSSSPISPFAGLPGEAISVPEGDYEVAMRAASEGKRKLLWA